LEFQATHRSNKIKMLDIKFVVQNPDVIKNNNKVRGFDVDVDRILQLEAQRKAGVFKLDNVRQEIKSLAKQWQDQTTEEARRQRARELKDAESATAAEVSQVEEQLEEAASWLPNVLDPRVPIGGEESNVVVREVGEIPKFAFTPRTHEELGNALNLLDIPRGVKAAKARFYCLKNEAVLMRMALIRMFLDHVLPQGFELICPPYMAKSKTLFASGYLPFSKKDNFKIENEDLSLIGTSEQALLGIHLDETLTRLPLLYVGDSMCFRTEAGSYGRDTAGILRVHQFYKLEQIVYCHPSESEKWHLVCLENEEWMMRELGIPYRVVITSSGDLGAPGRMKYDTEAWLPSQERYREMTSNTNLGDFQCRRGNIRFKIEGEKGFPHTISATGFVDRLMVAIWENCQQADGSVKIPEKLVRYMDGRTAVTAAAPHAG
jgi:seryl-tRNA synthetase